jgi:predicted TIM-barrel fold metal-dependent hydrolase
MEIIDVHTHLPYHGIFPNNFLQGLISNFNLATPQERILVSKMIRGHLKDRDGSQLIQNMDSAGINKAVLLIADFGIALGEAELTLEEIYQLHIDVIGKHADRFLLFGGMDPARGKPGVDLFERYVQKGVLAGLKLYPPCGFEMDDERLYPLYEICAQYKLPVLSHTGPSLSVLRQERRFPESIQKISADFREINFILGHGAAVDWKSNLDVVSTIDNVYFEISTFQAQTTDKQMLEQQFATIVNQVPDKVMFGSDWPMFTFSTSLKDIVHSIESIGTLTSTQLDKLFSKNARYILNIID